MNEKKPLCVYCQPQHRLLDELQPGETAEAAMARFSDEFEGLMVIDIVEAFRRQEDAAKTEPEEITAEEYKEKLDILPPVALTWSPGSGSFKICEPYIGGVHSIYARLGDRHFTFRDMVTMKHDEICTKVFHSAAYRQGREGGVTAGTPHSKDDANERV